MIVSSRAWKRHTKLSLVVLSTLKLQRQSACQMPIALFTQICRESSRIFSRCSSFDFGLQTFPLRKHRKLMESLQNWQELQGMRTAGTFKVERVLESPQSGAVTVAGGSGCQGMPRDAKYLVILRVQGYSSMRMAWKHSQTDINSQTRVTRT